MRVAADSEEPAAAAARPGHERKVSVLQVQRLRWRDSVALTTLPAVVSFACSPAQHHILLQVESQFDGAGLKFVDVGDVTVMVA